MDARQGLVALRLFAIWAISLLVLLHIRQSVAHPSERSGLNKLEQRDRFSLCFPVKTIDELIENIRSALCLVALNSPSHELNIT